MNGGFAPVRVPEARRKCASKGWRGQLRIVEGVIKRLDQYGTLDSGEPNQRFRPNNRGWPICRRFHR